MDTFSQVIKSLVRVEVGYAILLAAGFVAPHWISYRAWIPALALAILLAAGHGLLSRRKPILPAALLAYLGVYLLAAIHSNPDTFSFIEAGKFFAPPILGLAVAWAAQSARIRKHVIALALGAVLLQLPVTLGQAIDNLVERGRDQAVQGVDSITGLLGHAAGGTLTECSVLAGTLLVCAFFVGLRPSRWLLAGGIALMFVGVLTSTRASYAFVPLALAGIAAILWIGARRFIPRAKLALSLALAVLAMPVLVASVAALYPGANAPFTNVSFFLKNLVAAPGSAAAEESENASGAEATPAGSGGRRRTTTVLPGRGRQLTVAFDVVTRSDIDDTTLGLGIGATRFKQQAVLEETGATYDPITRLEQQANGTWLSRTLAETGFLGLAAFVGLLLYLVVLSWRNRDLMREPSWDAALVAALPGVAALTAIGAFFNTVLAIQPYASIFWPIVGVALAIDARSREDRASS